MIRTQDVTCMSRVMATSIDEDEERVKRKRAKRQKLEEKHQSGKVSKRKRLKNSEELQDLRKVNQKSPSFTTLHNEQDLHSGSSSQEHDLNSQSLSHHGLQLLDDNQHSEALHDKNEQSEDCTNQATAGNKKKLRSDSNAHEATEWKESMGSDTKKKKVKKKRDRWGQVLSDVGNVQDAVIQDDMLENAEITPSGHRNGDFEANHGICEGDYDNKTVCAGGMPYDTTEADILELFKKCGTIANVHCMKFADTQRFKGLAFITFKTEAAATEALSLDGVNMGGRHIKIEKAKAGKKVPRAPPKREPGSLSVYIGNLNWDIKKIDIKRFFKGCAIDDIRLAFDKHTGYFRGYGHVDFSDEKSLKMATKMDQKQLLGRPVKVLYAVSKGSKG